MKSKLTIIVVAVILIIITGWVYFDKGYKKAQRDFEVESDSLRDASIFFYNVYNNQKYSFTQVLKKEKMLRDQLEMKLDSINKVKIKIKNEFIKNDTYINSDPDSAANFVSDYISQ